MEPTSTSSNPANPTHEKLTGGRPLEFRPAIVAESLRISAGIVAHAAERLGCTTQTVRRYVREFPEVHDALVEAREMNLDLAETQLLKNVKAGKEASVFFLLKTLGKARGYVEGREVSGPNGGPVQYQERTTIDVSKLSHDEKMALLAAVVDPDATDES